MLRYGDTDNGYTLRIAVDGKDVAEGTEAEIPLNGTEASQTITLTLSHPDAPADRVYAITAKEGRVHQDPRYFESGKRHPLLGGSPSPAAGSGRMRLGPIPSRRALPTTIS